MKNPNVVNMLFGSHLYGLNTTSSDKDYKGIYLPEKRELLLGTYAKEYRHSTGNPHGKNTSEDVDTTVIALPTFVKFACEGETFAIDMLHCNEPLVTSDVWKSLVLNRTKFYSKNLKAFVGYVKRQAAKYGLKGSRLAEIKKVIEYVETQGTKGKIGELVGLPEGEHCRWIETDVSEVGRQRFYEVNGRKYQDTLSSQALLDALNKMYDSYGDRAKLAETNNGIDWKAVSHALRAGYQARDIYLNGDFQYPLKETPFILNVKTGQLNYTTEVAPVLESLVEEVDCLSDKSDLPKSVDRNWWDEWLIDVYWDKGY